MSLAWKIGLIVLACLFVAVTTGFAVYMLIDRIGEGMDAGYLSNTTNPGRFSG